MGLRELVLASCVWGLTSCVAPAIRVPESQARQSIEAVVEDAKDYLEKGDAQRAQGLLEQHEEIAIKERVQNKETAAPEESKETIVPPPDVAAKYLLAFSYLKNRAYDKAQTEFEELIDAFEKTPTIIELLQSKLADFVSTKEHSDLKKEVRSFTGFLPRLYGVLAFMSLIEQKYEQARDDFKKALSEFADRKSTYENVFTVLVSLARMRNDEPRARDYERVLSVFKQ